MPEALRSRMLVLAVLIMIFASLGAAAQETPRVEVFGGYQITRFNDDLGDSGRAFNMNGWDSELIFNATPNLGVVADVGGYYATPSTLPFTQMTCLGCPITFPGHEVPTRIHTVGFGPQLSFRKGSFRPFGHALFGVALFHQDLSALTVGPQLPSEISNSGFAVTLGGGLDTLMTERLALRFGVDYQSMDLSNFVHKDFRFSTGLIFRFGAH
jgi:opacity protein-like surface antigen